ncbi:MAG: glycosyltransferase family 39 protein [Bacteroidia bacterium]
MRIPLFWLFFCLLVLLACGLTDWINQPPMGVHQWRQADGASLMWFYYQGNSFFQPEIFNLETDGYGYAIGELPFTYWIAGKIACLFGWNVAILRWVHLLIFLSGTGSLVWILRQLLKPKQAHLFSALLVSILASTPVFTYYCASYLPDSPALSLVFLSWSLLFYGYRSDRKRWIYGAAVIAALSACLKLTMALSWAATVVALLLFPGKYPTISAAIRRHFLLSTSIWGLMIVGCRWWIMQYNAQYDSSYFLASVRPVWLYSATEIYEILMGLKYEMKGILSLGTAIGLAGVVYFFLKNRRKIHVGILLFIVLHIAGAVAVIVLFFRMYREHDYYTFALWPVPVLIALTMASYLRQQKRIIVLSVFLLLVNVLWTNRVLHLRAEDATAHPFTQSVLYGAEDRDWLSKSGISPAAHLFCPEDPSPNTLLFALNRQGWTAYNFGLQPDSTALESYRSLGLEYLVLTDTQHYTGIYPALFPMKIMEEEGIVIYQSGNSPIPPNLFRENSESVVSP